MKTLLNRLTKVELKHVLGGGVTPEFASPCADGGCTSFGGVIAHQLTDGSYAAGNCNELPVAQQVGCHNYCSNAATGSFWC